MRSSRSTTCSGPPKGARSPTTPPASQARAVRQAAQGSTASLERGLRGLRHVLAWAVGRRVRYRVEGPSMLPTLAPGDEVLVDPRAARRQRSILPGDLVLVQHPTLPWTRIIKRVAGFDADGRLELRGDNPNLSTDSRAFGAIDPAQVVGRVVWRFPL